MEYDLTLNSKVPLCKSQNKWDNWGKELMKGKSEEPWNKKW